MDLKATLEKLNLKQEDVTIASVNAEMMYPSIKFNLIEKAVKYYAASLNEQDVENVETCLELVKFGMSTTLLTFIDKYYMYDGDLESND